MTVLACEGGGVCLPVCAVSSPALVCRRHEKSGLQETRNGGKIGGGASGAGEFGGGGGGNNGGACGESCGDIGGPGSETAAESAEAAGGGGDGSKIGGGRRRRERLRWKQLKLSSSRPLSRVVAAAVQLQLRAPYLVSRRKA